MLLAACLRSLQTDRGSDLFEIFVVDNNSADGSVEMLNTKFPWVKTVANTENIGFTKACNQVIPSCRGTYVLLLNPDTVIKSDAISQLADYLDRNPKAGAVGPKILNPDGTLQLACRRSFPNPEAAFYRLSYLSKLFPNHPKFARYNLSYADPNKELEVDALSGSCMMVRQTVIEQIGLMDEAIFMYGEDIDWCWRVKQAGYSVNYCPEAVLYHYHGASSRFRKVGATINLHKGMEVFYRKHLAPRYPMVFNGFVYLSIWTRAAIFIVVAYLQSKFLSIRDREFDRISRDLSIEVGLSAEREAAKTTPLRR